MRPGLAILALLTLLACGGKSKGTPPAPAAALTPSTVSLQVLNGAFASPLGNPVTMFATVTYPATGTVVFLDGTTTQGQAPVGGTQNEYGAFLTTQLPTGPHALTARYPGDTQFTGSTSTPSQTLIIVPTTTPILTLVASPSKPSVLGQAVTFTVTISYPGAVATVAQTTGLGTVTFLDGTNPLQAGVPLANGTAACTISGLTVGSHTITAVFTTLLTANPEYFSNTVTQVVN